MSELSQLPFYKRQSDSFQAAQIISLSSRGDGFVNLELDVGDQKDTVKLAVDKGWVLLHRPVPGGYLVVDGDRSIFIAEAVFEQSFSRVKDPT